MISFYDKKSVANWTANIDPRSPVRAGPCTEWRGRSLMVCEFILGRANFELVHHRPVAGSGQTGLQRYYHGRECSQIAFKPSNATLTL